MFAPFTTAAKEEMFSPWCADPALAADLFPDETRTEARADKGEKSHQGFFGKTTLSPGITWSNSTSALGLRGVGRENRVGSRCTGKERDAESGLDNFGKRYYASSMGRFSSTDPGPYIWRDPQTLNRYTYTRNNPLRYVDPTGMYFVVAAEMQAQVKQYISTMLRSPEGAAMIRAISANPKPNFFSQGALDRHQVPGTNQIAVTNGTTTALAGNQPGQVAGTQTTLSNSNIAFTAGMSTGDIFAVGLKAFAHEDSHVVDINAAHTLQQAAAAGAAGDAPTQPGAENTAGGTAEANALGVMGELGAAGQSFQPNAQTDAQADAIIQGGMQQFGQDQQQQINQAVQHRGCTSDSEGQHCD